MPANAWVEDLRALLDYLGVQMAHVLGTSLGSRVAMRFGLDYPTRTSSIIVTSPHTYLTEDLDRGMNQYGDDGTKLPPAEQAERRKRHGEDWLEAHRNYYNIRNVPALQHYYNLSVSHPMHQVIGSFSEPITKIKSPILVVQSDNISAGRSVFDHAIELKNEMPNQVKLAIVPSYDTGARGIPGAMLRMVIVDFIDHLTPVPAGR
jgi:pimeloyl-ACP methyl ester carboxylesterase